MSGEIYICDVTVYLATHVRGYKYNYEKYTIHNAPIILVNGQIGSIKQFSKLKKYLFEQNVIKGEISSKFLAKTIITRAEFSSKTQYEFDPEIH